MKEPIKYAIPTNHRELERMGQRRQIMYTTVTRFTLAVVARNAPHLDVVQVAEMRELTLEELDARVNAMVDGPLSEFIVWLQDREREMVDLLTCISEDRVPAAQEYLHGKLHTHARALPLGEVMRVPVPPGYKAQSVDDAMNHLFGGDKPRPES